MWVTHGQARVGLAAAPIWQVIVKRELSFDIGMLQELRDATVLYAETKTTALAQSVGQAENWGQFLFSEKVDLKIQVRAFVRVGSCDSASSAQSSSEGSFRERR